LNSSDMYSPWAFAVAEEILTRLPEVEWLTTTTHVRYLPATTRFALGWIQQESTFWRRSLWERAGAQAGKDYPLAGDFELWARFFQPADLYAVETRSEAFVFTASRRAAATGWTT